MDIAELKETIFVNGYIPTILEKLGCHNITKRDGYYQCANPDGDNKSAITVYDNESLITVDYTRNISNKTADIFDLVKFFEKCNFFEALQKICSWCDIDYYTTPQDRLPLSVRVMQELYQDICAAKSGTAGQDASPIKPISEKILTYYRPWVNGFLKNDNISYETQREFEIGYDPCTNRITFPIRDELGNLVGVQGRLFKANLCETDTKYLFIEPVNKSKILYGLYKTFPFIDKLQKVFVTESAKGVMQLWDLGIKNSVAVFGKNISQAQADKISRLCADVCFLFDKDVPVEEIKKISQKFIKGTRVYAAIDRKGILDEKESPTDNPIKFYTLAKSVERII